MKACHQMNGLSKKSSIELCSQTQYPEHSETVEQAYVQKWTDKALVSKRMLSLICLATEQQNNCVSAYTTEKTSAHRNVVLIGHDLY